MSTDRKQLGWEIEYWCNDDGVSSVEKWLDQLTVEQLKAVAKELKLLGLCANTLRMPHSRSLQKGIFELRERKYGYRIYYVFQPGNRILLINAGNKDTQEKDIKAARKRFEELASDAEDKS